MNFADPTFWQTYFLIGFILIGLIMAATPRGSYNGIHWTSAVLALSLALIFWPAFILWAITRGRLQ